MRQHLRDATGELVRWSWDRYRSYGVIGPHSTAARRFGSFGEGSVMCFPFETLMNESAIHVGAHTLIGRDVSLAAGWGPDHPGLPDRVVGIGDRCLIGRGSSIIGHLSLEIHDDVWTGHHVRITDMNHGYEDLSRPISVQHQLERPVVIGEGSWLGHGVVVLPGVHIGRHVVVGAGSVVTRDLPDHSVAVGVPAVVVRRHCDAGWVRVADEAAHRPGDVPSRSDA
jgi:serine acetyltransferase